MKRIKKQVERRRNLDISPQELKSTVGFVVRIHEGRYSSIEIKNELKKLGLMKKYDGMFIRLDESNIGTASACIMICRHLLSFILHL